MLTKAITLAAMSLGLLNADSTKVVQKSKTDKVPSHAIVFNGEEDGVYSAMAVVTQNDKIALLSCAVNFKKGEDLQNYVNKRCLDLLSMTSDAMKIPYKIYYQVNKKKYLFSMAGDFVMDELLIEATQSISTYQVDGDTLDSLGSTTVISNNENPTIQSDRMTVFKVTEGDVNWDVLKIVPIRLGE